MKTSNKFSVLFLFFCWVPAKRNLKPPLNLVPKAESPSDYYDFSSTPSELLDTLLQQYEVLIWKQTSTRLRPMNKDDSNPDGSSPDHG